MQHIYYLHQGGYKITCVYLFIYLFIYLSVCLSVCVQHYAKTTGRILMKFSVPTAFGPRTTPLNFGGDPDQDPDSGSIFQFLPF